MNKSHIFLSLVCCIIFGVKLRAQTNVNLPAVIPPSPTAAAFARYGEIPVDHSTGVPKIEIPIYTLKAGNLTLPITFSYHASGVKVKDIASEVGLGWVLNAGGVISRTIMGKPDDNAANYQTPYRSKEQIAAAISAATTQGAKETVMEGLDAMYRNMFEMQSDRYTFNFNGHAGLFRYDFLNGSTKTIPYTPIKISRNGSAPTSTYQIVDEAGVIYDFTAQEYSNGYESSWRLKTITSADRKHTMNFFYSQESVIEEMMVSPTVVKDKKWTPHWGSITDEDYTEFKNNLSFVNHNPLKLDSIVTANTIISFTYAADRHDAGSARMTKLVIADRVTKSPISIIALDQSYFGDNNNPNRVNSRLRLDRLRIYGNNESDTPQAYAFEYNGSPSTFYDVHDASVYNYTSRFGFGEDYWGYYNGSNNNFPSQFMSFLSPYEISTYGGDRSANPTLMGGGNIKSIKYPTGGKTTFDFSANGITSGNYYPYSTTYPNALGGLKVDKITNYASDNTVSSTLSYEYIGNTAQNIASYQFYYEQPVTHIVEGYFFADTDHPQPYSFIFNTQKKVLVANALYSLGQSNGASGIYTAVVEYRGEKSLNVGKTVFNYEFPEPYGILNEALSRPQYLTFAQFDRGTYQPLLKSQEDYRFNASTGDYTLIRSLVNTYQRYHETSFNTGVQVARTRDYVTEGGGHIGYYNNYTDINDYLYEFECDNTRGYEDVKLLKTSSITENANAASPFMQLTTYEYGNQEHIQPTQKTVRNSADETLITQYKYPADFSTQFPYNLMMDNDHHLWTPVVEQTEFKNSTSTVLQSTKTDYTVFNNDNYQIYPHTVSTSTNGSSYEPRLQYLDYTTKGNIRSGSKIGAPISSYIWGYGDQYPIAEVKGAKVNEIYLANIEEKTDFPDWAMVQDNTRAHSGLYSGRIYNNGASGEFTAHSNTWLQINQNGQPRRYHYSGWVYSNGPSAEIFLFMKRPGEQGYFTYVDRVMTTETNRWVYLSKDFEVPADVVLLNIRLDNNGDNGGGNVWFDDIRLHPSEALMTSYTYKPLLGITSATDAKGTTTTYEYDSFGRLMNIRDQDQNILKHLDYHYKP